MVFRLDGGHNGHLPGYLLLLEGEGPIVNEGLEGLPVFALKHHPKLFPAGFVVIDFFSIDIFDSKVYLLIEQNNYLL